MSQHADNTYIADYYARRAKEYDKVYEKPERQSDIAELREVLREMLQGHRILEVACGTGFWTEPIADVAQSMVAVDVNEEVLEVARSRLSGTPKVRFLRDDAYVLAQVKGSYSAVFAGFWFSHVPKQKRKGFLETIHRKVSPGGLVAMADNRYVEGSNHPVTGMDSEGNTYQTRKLDNGRRYEVLKSFLKESDFTDLLSDSTEDFAFRELTYYWYLSYRIRKTP